MMRLLCKIFACYIAVWTGMSAVYAGNDSIRRINGTVICHCSSKTGTYLGSPSICLLSNGDYLICHDEFGKGEKRFNGNPVYVSKDKGKTWHLQSVISPGAKWCKIFCIGESVYLIGPSKKGGGILVYKSDDNGLTWTSPETLFADTDFHTAPTPVVVHAGRVWKGVDVIDNALPRAWPKRYCAAIVSAPENSDLMMADNWTLSNYVRPDFSCLDGKMGGWLEGNAVPYGKNMKLIMRVELPEGEKTERIAELNVSEDGKSITFDKQTGFSLMSGGAKKFSIRYDSKSRRYWTLANEIDSMPPVRRPGEVRNILSLLSSADLQEWVVNKRVIQSDDIEYTGFQYVDWQIDGRDIVFVSMTSYYDDTGGAHNYHDSNYIPFHMIKNFRKYNKALK